MIDAVRKSFNREFSTEKYQRYQSHLTRNYPGSVEFRLAETPVFIPKNFLESMMAACDAVIDQIKQPDFLSLTERAIPSAERLPNETGPCQLICFDFGVCQNKEGQLEPQLIEMQGFASLFAFQVEMDDSFSNCFNIPAQFSPYLSGYNKSSYLQVMKELFLGTYPAEEVILLEIIPDLQKTRLDFYLTSDYWGIQSVCLTELIGEGKTLYYVNKQTKKKTKISRIYNRFIFDDLKIQSKSLPPHIDITKEWQVEWLPHPNWFYRISKFTLPLLNHRFIPTTWYLNQLKEIPKDLENYVLKPLFSFAGQGVIIDLDQSDLKNIPDPENWILQRKVHYAEAIVTPGSPAKVEIRLMYIWKPEWERPKPVINLCRLSKGKMIGVRYNQNQEWVGGTIGYFEQ